MRAAERIFRRRIRPNEIVTREFASLLCSVSHDANRQLGVLINRRGEVDHVIFGDANEMWLPDVGRLRSGAGRLRGLRLIHTHLRQEPLSNDDLTDLALLRLDVVVAITMSPEGRPLAYHSAHLLPGAGKTPWTLLPTSYGEPPGLDVLELVQSLEEEFARIRSVRTVVATNRALLIHVTGHRERSLCEARIAELKELCRTSGVEVADVIVQRRKRIDPRYVVGRGKLDDVVLRANQLDADLLIFDPDLAPAQARAISNATELKVIDRSMLILDIFAQHAKSRDGKLQVELAQLRYTLPRLIAKNTMMSRLTGGIGGRGPGETKLEINRRRARDRIARLEKKLTSIAEERQQRRQRRSKRGVPLVAIVGYTNAGKSTLLNTLTQSDALVADKLFATLSPLSRRLRFPRERELILTDTVGFIHDLPDELIQAFRATLEELYQADLLLHLVDISDSRYAEQITSVCSILDHLQLDHTDRLLVMNKADAVDLSLLQSRLAGYSAVAISATDRSTIHPLLHEMERRLWSNAVSGRTDWSVNKQVASSISGTLIDHTELDVKELRCPTDGGWKANE